MSENFDMIRWRIKFMYFIFASYRRFGCLRCVLTCFPSVFAMRLCCYLMFLLFSCFVCVIIFIHIYIAISLFMFVFMLILILLLIFVCLFVCVFVAVVVHGNVHIEGCSAECLCIVVLKRLAFASNVFVWLHCISFLLKLFLFFWEQT